MFVILEFEVWTTLSFRWALGCWHNQAHYWGLLHNTYTGSTGNTLTLYRIPYTGIYTA